MNKKWTGQWIEYNPHPLSTAIYHKNNAIDFYTDFQIESLPEKCTVDISGLGFYILEINGCKATEDILTPAFSAYNKTVFYNTYDITDLLKRGKNTVNVTVGNGWFLETVMSPWLFEHAVWSNRPQLICEFFADGKLVLKSDSGWKCKRSKTVYNSLRYGETHDSTAEFNDEMPAFISHGPGGLLKPQPCPPIRLQEVIDPVSVFENGIYDFGINISGNTEITVKGNPGDRVIIQYSESIDENGEVDLKPILPDQRLERFQRDEYILSGKGIESWHSNFGYNGFRYAKITSDAKIISVKARCFYTDLKPMGDFECNNDFYNQLHKACTRSILTNFHHIPTDCPHREKNGWTGDALLSCEASMLNFDMKDAYLKWLDDIADCQTESGAVPCIAPTSVWGYNWGTGNCWDAVIFEIPYQMYCYYGDIGFLTRYKPVMKKYLVFLERMSDNGIWKNGLGDWCSPDNSQTISIPAILTAYAYRMTDIYRKICKITNDLEDYDYYCKLAEKIKSDFINEFEGKEPDSQAFLAIRIQFGLTDNPQDLFLRLCDLIEKDSRINCGIFGVKWMFNLLSRNGRSDLAEKILDYEDYPGYRYMLRNGNGTLCEAWSCSSSKNHHMYSSIDDWFYKSVAGINYDEANTGFKHIIISPCPVASVSSFSAWHITPFGKVSVSLKSGIYTVAIPENCIADFIYRGTKQTLKAGENIICVK